MILLSDFNPIRVKLLLTCIEKYYLRMQCLSFFWRARESTLMRLMPFIASACFQSTPTRTYSTYVLWIRMHYGFVWICIFVCIKSTSIKPQCLAARGGQACSELASNEKKKLSFCGTNPSNSSNCGIPLLVACQSWLARGPRTTRGHQRSPVAGRWPH